MGLNDKSARFLEGMTRREAIGGAVAVAVAAAVPHVAQALPPVQQAGPSLPLLVRQIPLSRFGSYVAVSNRFWTYGADTRTPVGSFYIRSLQGETQPTEIFRIELLRDGIPLVPDAELTAGKLSLFQGDARVDFCIATAESIRIRGHGCKLVLHAITEDYASAFRNTTASKDSLQSWTILPDAARSPVEVRQLAGRMKVDAPWVQSLLKVQIDKAVVTLEADDRDAFECVLHFFEGVSPQPTSLPSFDQAVASVDAEYERWLARVPTLPPEYEPRRRHAAYVLWSNFVPSGGLYRTPVLWGSKNWMTRIWSWDHCFHALGLARSHPELAWQQFMIFRDMQDPASGMLADSFTSVRRSWVCTKNPIHGWTLAHLMRTMPDFITRERLMEAYGPLVLWTEFWQKHRNFDGDGLPCIVHPDESFDNTTNNSLEGPMKAPEIATYLVLQMDTLAQVAARLGYQSDALRWRRDSEHLVTAIQKVLWDDAQARFVSRHVGDGAVASGDCVLPFIPLMLGDRLPKNMRSALVAGLLEPGRFLTPFGFSTESLKSPLYNGETYVKGPVWGPPTLFLAEALQGVGQTRVAHQVTESFCRLVLRNGTSEHYDARTGKPGGDPAYGWSAALFLWLAQSFASPTSV